MIRRILDFVIVLLFVWICMFLGLFIIDNFIVPMRLPSKINGIITGILEVIISGILAIIWLWLWRNIVKKMFWSRLKDRQE